jgi:hypothetical protein
MGTAWDLISPIKDRGTSNYTFENFSIVLMGMLVKFHTAYNECIFILIKKNETEYCASLATAVLGSHIEDWGRLGAAPEIC